MSHIRWLRWERVDHQRGCGLSQVHAFILGAETGTSQAKPEVAVCRKRLPPTSSFVEIVDPQYTSRCASCDAGLRRKGRFTIRPADDKTVTYKPRYAFTDWNQEIDQ